MKKSKIQNIFVHIVESTSSNSLPDKINEFHMQVIERKLNELAITPAHKTIIIDKIIDNLKSRENQGIIQ